MTWLLQVKKIPWQSASKSALSNFNSGIMQLFQVWKILQIIKICYLLKEIFQHQYYNKISVSSMLTYTVQCLLRTQMLETGSMPCCNHKTKQHTQVLFGVFYLCGCLGFWLFWVFFKYSLAAWKMFCLLQKEDNTKQRSGYGASWIWGHKSI